MNQEENHKLFTQTKKVPFVMMMLVYIGWKSQRICAHVVAAAEAMKCLDSFIVSYRKSKMRPNYTAVVMHTQPLGSKPGTRKRKAPANLQRPCRCGVSDKFISVRRSK